MAGTPASCDDGDPCTVDACSAGACAHTPRDLDGDGHADACAGGDDCAPLDPSVFPGADEVCNRRDDDCDLDVDEGLAFAVTQEVVLDVPGRKPRAMAVLGDGTVLGHPVDGQIRGVHDGTLVEAVFRDTAPLGWIDFFAMRRALVDSDGAWVVDIDGVDWQSPFGTARTAYDSVTVRRVVMDEAGLVVTPGRVIAPPSGERDWPAFLSASWVGPSPFALWAAARGGKPHLLLTPMDSGDAEPVELARTGGPVTSIALAGSPEGATALWVERLPGPSVVLWAMQLGPDAMPRSAATIVAEASALEIEACSLAGGETAIAWVSTGPAGVDRSIVVLDPQLTGTEPLTTFSDDGYSRAPPIQCEGRSVWLVDARALRRVHRDASFDVRLALGTEGARLVPSASVWWTTMPADPDAPSTVREVACVP